MRGRPNWADIDEGRGAGEPQREGEDTRQEKTGLLRGEMVAPNLVEGPVLP